MFRIATPADASAIASLHTINWQRSYRGAMTDHYLDTVAPTERLEVWTQRLNQPNARLQVALAEAEDGTLMGFSCVFPHHSAVDGHLLDNLHVHPDFRRLGLGKKLMRHSAQWLLDTGHQGEIYLWVLTSNLSAIRFYEIMRGRAGRIENHTFAGDQTTEAMMMSWELTELATDIEKEVGH
ncbi:MAG: N-acetyltransferase family protein [Lewinella sp.]